MIELCFSKTKTKEPTANLLLINPDIISYAEKYQPKHQKDDQFARI